MRFLVFRALRILPLIVTTAAIALGEVVDRGPWAGRHLIPIGAADIEITASPLAAVLVCRHSPQAYDRINAFEQAMQTTATLGVPAYVIVLIDNDDQADVVEEIVRQRGVKLPVFATTDNFTRSGECSLFVVTDKEALAVTDGDLSALPTQIAARRSESGLSRPADTVTTTPRATPASNPLYVNQRYGFSIRWPSGWAYKVARNNDGAVGIPPQGSQLEARVWAAPEIKSQDPTDPAPYVQIKDYLDYVKTLARAEVSVLEKLKVFDGDIEGRDYTYSYTRIGKEGQPDQKYRGRIQCFVVDGIAKIACVEGPEEEFRKRERLIDEFIYSFHPTLD